MRHIPVERFDGSVPSPIAIYRPPILGAFGQGIDATMVGVAHFASVPNVAVGGPVTQVQEPTPGASIPFRRATTFRTTQIVPTSQALAAGSQLVEITVEGSGYIYGIDLHASNVTAANAAAVTFAEDGPWNAFDTIVLKDVNGELVNVTGYSLRLVNLYAGYAGWRNAEPVRAEAAPSGDTANIFSLTTGAVGTGGSFRFHTFVPCGLNRRDLRGILGNQDRAQKYSLRDDYAANASIYGVAPTNPGTLTVERHYENYAVPSASNANGAPQAQYPDDFGILHYVTQATNASPPVGGGGVNHFLPRLGNTIRLLILVLRSNSTRANAETNQPTRLQLNLGDTPIFVESAAYRLLLMWRRYGFDAPNGVFVYDFMTDIIGHAGDELGDDYLFTNGLVNAQFQITYPAGFGAAANSLLVITDDLVIPPTVDIYA